jgi:ATP-dependent RNA helicase SUPV3L1/SUV3
MIEVWRQQRPPQRHRQQGDARGHAQHGQGERRDRGRRERGPRPNEQPRAAAPAGAAVEAVSTDAAAPAPERPQEARDGRSNDLNRGRRRDRHQGPRPERRAEASPSRAESSQTQSPPRPDKRQVEKRAPKPIDPDNPFAKLLALKARMEEEGRR